jgi:ABC-type lipoprotein release transport system permease subunit
VIVAAVLAAGAAAALALTLVAGVRSRRRELAMLKTLGYTRLQVASAVAWQASVTALVGVVIGVPLGIAAGRALWNLFARSIDAVPQPTVPAVSVLVIAIGALLLATIVAVLPARLAARTPAAAWLRTE